MNNRAHERVRGRERERELWKRERERKREREIGICVKSFIELVKESPIVGYSKPTK